MIHLFPLLLPTFVCFIPLTIFSVSWGSVQSHSISKVFLSCSLFLSVCFRIFLPNSFHKCSMGLMSGNCGGVWSSLGILYNSHSLTILAMCFWVLDVDSKTLTHQVKLWQHLSLLFSLFAVQIICYNYFFSYSLMQVH